MILENLSPDIAGKIRDYDVSVGGRSCLSHTQVKSHLSELLNHQPKNPLAALNWHVSFEKIHPFGDGNGRVGRMLYAWHCQRNGNAYITFTDADKFGYYGLFK
jgi:fido (protein-threonine AMPylation protein)